MVAPFRPLAAGDRAAAVCFQAPWGKTTTRSGHRLGLITRPITWWFCHNTPRMLLSLVEYVGFMALIGSLYVIAGAFTSI